ncbi:hypothetical protein Tco_0496113 [Tanacetum coccineum]
MGHSLLSCYGTEAVIPAESANANMRTAEVISASNADERRYRLGNIGEKGSANKRPYVRKNAKRPGDFVYRANDASHAEDTGKRGTKWGRNPRGLRKHLEKGAYKFALNDTWCVSCPARWTNCYLKKCYYL